MNRAARRASGDPAANFGGEMLAWTRRVCAVRLEELDPTQVSPVCIVVAPNVTDSDLVKELRWLVAELESSDDS